MNQVVSFTSFVVSLVALIIAIMAWRRPFPADPTAVPSFGSAAQPKNLDDSKVMKQFFEFLRKHAGRKVMLYTNMAARPEEIRRLPDDMTTDALNAREASNGTRDRLYVPRRPDNANAIGISYQHGLWHLRGYYADAGVVDIAQGFRVHRLIALSDNEAVS
jgi:hypothetical protein